MYIDFSEAEQSGVNVDSSRILFSSGFAPSGFDFKVHISIISLSVTMIGICAVYAHM